MTEIGPQFEGVSPIWKKEAREMDAVDARQAASPIHIYEGDGWTMDNGDQYNTVYAAKSAGYGRHTILGRVQVHAVTGVAHIDTHPDLSPSQRAVTAISMLKAADKIHRQNTGKGISTDYGTSVKGNRFIKSLLPKSTHDTIESKRETALQPIIEPDQDKDSTIMEWTDSELRGMYDYISKDSKKRIVLQKTYDPKTLKSNGKKTWLA